MLQTGMTSQKQSIIQHNRTTPVIQILQQDMLIRRFQNQRPIPRILRLNRGLTRHLPPHSLTQKIAYSFHSSRSIHIPRHPLHCSRLNCHLRLTKLTDYLTLTNIHLITKIRHLRILRIHTQILYVFYHCKSPFFIQHTNITIIRKISNLIHKTYPPVI